MTALGFSRRLFSAEDGRRPYAYNRLSKIQRDTAADITLGTERQANDADKLAETWEIPGELIHVTDAGESASRFRRRERTGWPQLLDAINAGAVSVVLVWVWDRIIRDTNDQNALIDACRNAGILIIQSASGTIIDPDNPDSVAMAKIQGVLAEAEVAKTSKRVRRAHEDIRENGRFSGGRRAFGYGPGMRPVTDNAELAALVAREAEAYAGAFTAVLNGESITSISRGWNAAGLRTTAGNLHSPTTVSRMLRRRYVLGVRELDGKDVPAEWPAIVDASIFAAAQRRLAERAAPYAGKGFTGARVYELSGVLLCGECGTPMRGTPTALKSGAAYTCRRLNRGTAGHGQAQTDKVWRTVRAQVCRILTHLDAAGVFVVEADRNAAERRHAERMALTARRDEELPDAAALGDCTPAQVKRMTATINARLAELGAADDAETDAASRPARVLAGLVGMSLQDTKQAFDALPVDRQRAVIAELGTPVLRRDPSPRRGVYNPRRVLFVHSGGRLDETEPEDVA